MATASILDGTKKALGIGPEFDDFDPDIIMHINSTLATLNQIGVGPVDGFAIEDKEASWEDFIGDSKVMNFVKSYMYLKVRLLFDPPATSFALDSMKRQADEFEWRLLVAAEPSPTPNLEENPDE
jgi:hypothetical protein